MKRKIKNNKYITIGTDSRKGLYFKFYNNFNKLTLKEQKKIINQFKSTMKDLLY